MTKLWKIKNTHTGIVKIAISTSSNGSMGVQLSPNESIVCLPRQTPSMDAQTRRKFISVDKNFDNTAFGLKMGICYSDEAMEKAKMDKAAADATQYTEK